MLQSSQMVTPLPVMNKYVLAGFQAGLLQGPVPVINQEVARAFVRQALRRYPLVNKLGERAIIPTRSELGNDADLYGLDFAMLGCPSYKLEF